MFGMSFHPQSDANVEEGGLEAIEADGLIGINNTDFMVSYMSPRWSVPPFTLVFVMVHAEWSVNVVTGTTQSS